MLRCICSFTGRNYRYVSKQVCFGWQVLGAIPLEMMYRALGVVLAARFFYERFCDLETVAGLSALSSVRGGLLGVLRSAADVLPDDEPLPLLPSRSFLVAAAIGVCTTRVGAFM